MNAPSCIDPLFREVIERHFPDLKISPGNGNEVTGDVRRGTANELATQERGKPSSDSIPSVPNGPNGENARDAISRCVSPNVANPQYLHYAILCLALLEENAILKQRLENLAKVEAEMFPK